MPWKPWGRPEKSEAERQLEELQQGAAAPAPGSDFRLVVEDVFSIRGRGTVVTGTVASGSVAKGQAVTLTRTDGTRRGSEVTGVEAFRKLLDRAEAGQNVGLLLRGVEREDVGRGDVITA